MPDTDLSGKPLGDASWLLPALAMGLVSVGFALWMLRAWERPRRGSKDRSPVDDGEMPRAQFDEPLDEELARLDD